MKKFIITLISVLFFFTLMLNKIEGNKSVEPCGIWPVNMSFNYVNDLFEFDLAGHCDDPAIYRIWLNGEIVETGFGLIGDHIEFTIPEDAFLPKIGGCGFDVECETMGTTVNFSFKDGCVVVINGCVHGPNGPW